MYCIWWPYSLKPIRRRLRKVRRIVDMLNGLRVVVLDEAPTRRRAIRGRRRVMVLEQILGRGRRTKRAASFPEVLQVRRSWLSRPRCTVAVYHDHAHQLGKVHYILSLDSPKPARSSSMEHLKLRNMIDISSTICLYGCTTECP